MRTALAVFDAAFPPPWHTWGWVLLGTVTFFALEGIARLGIRVWRKIRK